MVSMGYPCVVSSQEKRKTGNRFPSSETQNPTASSSCAKSSDSWPHVNQDLARLLFSCRSLAQCVEIQTRHDPHLLFFLFARSLLLAPKLYILPPFQVLRPIFFFEKS